MQTRWEEFVNREARFDPGAAVTAGLVGGVIAWLLSHGIPWFTSGMVSPSFMGRDVSHGTALSAWGESTVVGGHFVLGICYALVLAPLVTHVRGMWAVVLGGIIGLALYGLNFCAFHFLLGVNWSGAEVQVIVTHVVFGLIGAGIYKGLAARKNVARSQPPVEF